MKLVWSKNWGKSSIDGATQVRTITKPIKMSIYKKQESGDKLYFTCPILDIVCADLMTENWEEAEDRAISFMKLRADALYKDICCLENRYRNFEYYKAIGELSTNNCENYSVISTSYSSSEIL